MINVLSTTSTSRASPRRLLVVGSCTQESGATAQTTCTVRRKDHHRHWGPLPTATSAPPAVRGVQQLCRVCLGALVEIQDARAERNFCQQDDPEFQICLDELHNGVLDGEAWGVLLTRVVGLDGNQELEHTTHDSLINASCLLYTSPSPRD